MHLRGNRCRDTEPLLDKWSTTNTCRMWRVRLVLQPLIGLMAKEAEATTYAAQDVYSALIWLGGIIPSHDESEMRFPFTGQSSLWQKS